MHSQPARHPSTAQATTTVDMARKRPKTSAEQPVTQTGTKQPGQEHLHVAELKKPGGGGSLTDSAAQPVAGSYTKRDGPQGYNDEGNAAQVLRDCSDWLKALPPQDILQSKTLQRLQSATDLLQSRSSRQQRQLAQQLPNLWGVPQKAHGCKRKCSEVAADLVAKLAEEARRLQRMQGASCTLAGAGFSAIQHAFHHRSVVRLA